MVENKPTVAVLGLGAMGSRMAPRLVAGGWPVQVYDVRPSAAQAVAGARACSTAREVASGARFVVLTVRDYSQIAEACAGENGVLAGTATGTTLILMSTIAPPQARQLAETASEAGVEVLDAPMSGGTPGAAGGTLSIMAGGPAERFERCRSILEALGERIYHVGLRVGDGQSAKMVNQLLCGVHLAAAAEAMVLARKAGLDQELILDLVSNSAAGSWMLSKRAPRMVARRFDDLHSALALLYKDLSIVVDGANSVNAPTPLAAAAREVFKWGAAMGYGDLDDSSLMLVYERLAGIEQ